MKNGPKTVDILGVRVASGLITEVLGILQEKLDQKAYDRTFFLVTVNTEFIMLAQEDLEFKKILNEADFALADGAGLKLGGVKQVVAGRKLIEEILRKKYRVFYLGGRDRVAEKMAEKYGGEWDEGEKDIRGEERERVRIINKINKCKPDLLLVAYGAPWQEKWIAANKSGLKAKMVIGVGGTFDYLTGKSKPPPEWMAGIGLEWFWRLIHESWRWRRQTNLIRFVGLLIKEKLKL